MGVADFSEHEVDGALVDFDLLAVDEHGVEDFVQMATDKASVPVIFGGDRSGESADFGGEGGPDEDDVEVAGVVGEIDTLTGIGLGVDPAHADAADESGNPDE